MRQTPSVAGAADSLIRLSWTDILPASFQSDIEPYTLPAGTSRGLLARVVQQASFSDAEEKPDKTYAEVISQETRRQMREPGSQVQQQVQQSLARLAAGFVEIAEGRRQVAAAMAAMREQAAWKLENVSRLQDAVAALREKLKLSEASFASTSEKAATSAAALKTAEDTFAAVKKRASLATMIGNAVPPALAATVFEALLPSLLEEAEAA